ncbi:hypothetical protein TWF788_005068 [Orbilia oligospora]|uniref:F-box domain-containing protein n=1 Tax=Orbilia oligospora TaxID=2813651 RepID=A0A7C8PZ27_ORBOL|nr:hypothetical protein TWF788_005068 [Orbilia oligospora]
MPILTFIIEDALSRGNSPEDSVLDFTHISSTPVKIIDLSNPRTKQLIIFAKMKLSGKITNYYHSPLSTASVQRIRNKHFPIEPPQPPPHMSYKVPIAINSQTKPLKLIPTVSSGQHQEGYLSKIPREIFDEITSNLGASDLVALSQTCVDFFTIIAYDQNFWYNRLLNVNKPPGPGSYKYETLCPRITSTLLTGRKRWYDAIDIEEKVRDHHEVIACWNGEFDDRRFYYKDVVEILKREDWGFEYETCECCLTQKGVNQVFNGTRIPAQLCGGCVLERFGGERNYTLPIIKKNSL